MASQKDYCPLLPQDQEREEGGPPAKTLEAEGVPCKSARRRRLELRRLRPDVDIATGYCSPLPSPPSAASLSASSDEISADRAAKAFGSISVIGRRHEMEDAVAVAPAFAAGDLSGDRPYDFCGVYDGHSGARVAQECGARMHVVVAEEMAARRPEAAGGGDEGIGWWRDVMAASFERIDGEMAEEAVATVDMTVGSTAVVAVVGQDRIVVANCGDSRAVLSRGRIAVPLSSDHKITRVFTDLRRNLTKMGNSLDTLSKPSFTVLQNQLTIAKREKKKVEDKVDALNAQVNQLNQQINSLKFDLNEAVTNHAVKVEDLKAQQ